MDLYLCTRHIGLVKPRKSMIYPIKKFKSDVALFPKLNS